MTRSWLACLNFILCGLLHDSDVGEVRGVAKQSYADTIIRIWEMTKGRAVSDNLYYQFSNFTADNHYLILASE